MLYIIVFRVDIMRNRIEIEKIKRIPIVRVLELHGVLPAKIKANRWIYFALSRQEKTPSLNVNLRTNYFKDFGSGEKGSVIDIVMLLKNFDIKEAIDYLKSFDSANFEENKNEIPEQLAIDPLIVVDKVLPLTHPALLQFAKLRGIKNDLISKYCHQIQYSTGDRSFFAIGFKNEKGGFELRNKLFKGCTTKWYSFIKNSGDNLLIFEGFFDFLSLLTSSQKARRGNDYLVLNSCSLREKVPVEMLEQYDHIFLFLDNDQTGKDTANYFLTLLPNVTDCSILYAQFNDVNDWLINKLTHNKNNN